MVCVSTFACAFTISGGCADAALIGNRNIAAVAITVSSMVVFALECAVMVEPPGGHLDIWQQQCLS
jgi:hypothetical protein